MHRFCSMLCGGENSPENYEQSVHMKHQPFSASNKSDVLVLKFEKSHIQRFLHFIDTNRSINFLQTFFEYVKNVKNEEIHLQNTFYKIAFLEQFISTRKQLPEISSLSSNGVTGYLLVDQRIDESDKKVIVKMLTFCQKRALMMLENKPFKNFLRRYPIMREQTLAKKMQMAAKLKKWLKTYNPDFFAFFINSDAKSRIMDFRLSFYNKLSQLCISYHVLLTAYCYSISALDLYQLIENFKEIRAMTEEINTKFFMLASSKISEKLNFLEVSQELLSVLEQIYFTLDKKNSGTPNQDQTDKEITKNALFEKVLEYGLKIVKKYKLLSDRHHFSGLESFLLQRAMAFTHLQEEAKRKNQSQPTSLNSSPSGKKKKKKKLKSGTKKKGSASPIKRRKKKKGLTGKKGVKSRLGRIRAKRDSLELCVLDNESGVVAGDGGEFGKDTVIDLDEVNEILMEDDDGDEEAKTLILSTIREVSDTSEVITKSDFRSGNKSNHKQSSFHFR